MILALDLEYTLITNAVSVFVRPHLNEFLKWADAHFERTVLYTTVSPERIRTIQDQLFNLGEVNYLFHEMKYVDWPRKGLKDLSLVNPDWRKVIMIDDLPEHYAVPEQLDQWIKITAFDYCVPDTELEMLINVLANRLLSL